MPAEEVEELPEAIIIPVPVTIQNLTAQNQKILLSGERKHRLFSGLGLFVVFGMYAAVLVVEIYMLRVWRYASVIGGQGRVRVRVKIYSYLFITASCHCWTFSFHF